MKRIHEQLISIINGIDRRLLIFLLLALTFLSFDLHPNEETKFGIARFFADKDWIKDSFSFGHDDPTKFLFNILAGNLLKYLGFEQLAFFGRLTSYIVFAFILSRIFNLTGFDNLYLSLILLFYFDHQSLLGGGSIFKSFEPKTIAYVFILFGLYKLFRKKHFQCSILLGIATLFHLLAGAWTMLAAAIYMLFEDLKFKKVISFSFLYLFIVAPLLYFVFRSYNSCPTSINGINTDWIYVYFRNAHHIGFFKSFDYFFQRHAGLVFINLIFFLVSLFVYKKHTSPVLKRINKFVLILLSLQFISLIIGIFDKNGVFLKSYPYRINTLSTLFFFICTGMYFKNFDWDILPRNWNKEKVRKRVIPILRISALTFVMVIFSLNSFKTIAGIFEDYNGKRNNEFYSYIEEITDQEDLLLISEYCEADYLDFIRKTRRDRFVVFKFVPSNHCQIYEWYTRYKLKEKASAEPSLLPELKRMYSVDYFISCDFVEASCLKYMKTINGLHIYKIK